jgi:hypothetical protein
MHNKLAQWCVLLARLGPTREVRCAFVLLVSLLGRAAEAQTNCATQHTNSGVFICYPNPAEDGRDSLVPDVFHLSAQANPDDGHVISGYKVLIDNEVTYQNKFSDPMRTLSIETNLKSPFDSGSHLLRLLVEDVGSADVQSLQFYPSRNAAFCDPFSRADPRVCNPSTIRSPRAPFQWSLTERTPRASGDIFETYSAYIALYGQNLKRIEADVADAMAVDTKGNLYVASHAFADVDLRKYSPNGSLIYATLVRSCGDGFLSVEGLAIDNDGHAWIAGNTTACLAPTPNAVPLHVNESGRMHGFVILVDTAKPGSEGPLYVAYVSETENRIAAIRVDSDGNAYVTGTAASHEFPHESSLSVSKSSDSYRDTGFGFVSVLNRLGSGLLWSTLLQIARPTALALDGMGNVYVTGRTASDVLVAELSDRGRRLSYVAQFRGSSHQEGRAISSAAQGAWILVAGDTDAAVYPASPGANTGHRGAVQSFAAGLQPCRTGVQYARLLTETDRNTAPGIAIGPALDAFAALFSSTSAANSGKAGQEAVTSVQTAPPCIKR